MHRAVIDTNVIVSALRSKRGASHRLMSLLGDSRFQITISVALVLEYEAAAKNQCAALNLPESIVDDIVDMICAVGRQTKVHYRWRPHLKDSGDDFVLELAVSGDCEFIVTYNLRDFQGADQFGVRVVTPREFLAIIEETT